jgi:hypothetical protein
MGGCPIVASRLLSARGAKLQLSDSRPPSLRFLGYVFGRGSKGCGLDRS